MTEVITDKFYEKDGSDKKEMEEIEKQISVLDKKIRSVRMKYALEEIDEPTCRDAVEPKRLRYLPEHPETGASPGNLLGQREEALSNH